MPICVCCGGDAAPGVWWLAGLFALTAALISMARPPSLGTTPLGFPENRPVVATLTGNDLSLAQTLVQGGYLPTDLPSVPSGVASADHATASIPAALTPNRTRSTRARIGSTQPRRGLRDTPTSTARAPQLGNPDLPTTKYSITVGVRGGNIPKLWFRRFVEFLKEKAVAGGASIEIGGDTLFSIATSMKTTFMLLLAI